jgi:hypothetical protein
VGGGKKAPKKKPQILPSCGESSSCDKTKQHGTKKNKKQKTKQTNKQTNRQVGSLLTGPESIFTAASERILIP